MDRAGVGAAALEHRVGGERSTRLEQLRQSKLASGYAAHLGARWADTDVVGGHFERRLRQLDQQSASFTRHRAGRVADLQRRAAAGRVGGVRDVVVSPTNTWTRRPASPDARR